MWMTQLSQRERTIVGVALVGLSLFAVSFPVTALEEFVAENQRLVVVRKREFDDLSRLLQRYGMLKRRLEELQATFDKSQMEFSDLTSKLDSIVKESVGSDNYELKRSGSPAMLGPKYEKQNFTLKVQSLTLEQLVKLLYRLEQGASSLFLGKVDILRSYRGDLSVTMEIFSIRRAEAGSAGS